MSFLLVPPRSAAGPSEADGSDAAFSARAERLLEVARQQLLGTGRWDLAFDPPRNNAANDLGKHWWPRLFAELAAGHPRDHPIEGAGRRGDQAAAVTLRDLVRGLIHNAPDDRGPRPNPAIGYLYFSPVGIGYVLHAFPGAVADDDWRTLVRATIDFDPTLSALNPFTGQGTENHMLLGRTGGYLVCLAVVERGANDPVTGAWYDRARAWLPALTEYFVSTAETTYERGFGEWDSSIYYPYVIACWVALHDFADPDVRTAATAVLDWIAATVAVRSTAGVFGGPEQRSAAPLRPGESNLDQLGWLWWGHLPGGDEPVWRRQDFGQLVYVALSRYRPPALTGRIARGEIPAERLGTQFETKPSYLVHGADSVRQQTRVVFHRGPGYSLGAAVARPTGGWTGGDAQDLLWKLVVETASAPGAQVAHGGVGRDPWRQVAQWENTLFDVWHLPPNAAELRDDAMARVAEWRRRRGESLRAAFLQDTSRENTVRPRAVAVEGVRATLVLAGERVAALAPVGPTFFDLGGEAWLAVRPVGAGLGEIAPGGFGGYVLEVGTAAEHGDRAQFEAAVRARDAAHPPQIDDQRGRVRLRSLSGVSLEFEYQTSGTYVEPEFDWGFGAEQPGGYVIMAMPPFRFPQWPQGEGHGRVPEMRVNGRSLAEFFDDATYRGPLLEVRDGWLTLSDGRTTFRRSACAAPEAP
jgi:hypothetical protein